MARHVSSSNRHGAIRLGLAAQIGLITLVFAGFYVGMRNMPAAKCGFLHYEVTEVLADGSEVCATDSHAGFLDLTELNFPAEMIVTLENEPRKGEPLDVSFRFIGADGQQLLPHHLAITHTERIHLMVVDPSLDDYHHLHPEAVGGTGVYQTTFTPQRGGTYRLFAEFVPVRTKRQVVVGGEITVPGDAVSPSADGSRLVTEDDGIRFALQPERGDRLRAGRDQRVDLTIERTDGRPVILEEVMGDVGHMVAFDRERRGFAHMHPAYTGHETDPDPELGFYINVPDPGTYRLFAQVQIDGRERFIPFDLEVQ